MRLNFTIFFTLLFLSFLLCVNTFAADFSTPGSGLTYTLAQIASFSGNTTVSGSPTSYTLQGNLTISAADTLNITTGEALRAAADPAEIGYAIIIRGRLTAVGSISNHAILGAHEPTPGIWRGIMINSNAQPASLIRYCDISHARIGVSVRGSLPPAIENNDFTDCMVSAVHVFPGFSATIQNNHLSLFNDGTGINLDSAVNSQISSNTLTGGLVGIASAKSDSNTTIQFNSLTNVSTAIASETTDTTKIENNYISGGDIGAVIFMGAQSQWSSNTFINQTLAGMGVVNNATPKLRNNQFSNNGSLGGITLDDTAQPDLGSVIDNGLNQFATQPQWDLVNFSPMHQYAIGNTWSGAPPDDHIYDDDEDVGDTDGNGVISGIVAYSPPPSTVDGWLFYDK